MQIENLRQNYSYFYLKEFSATTIADNPAHNLEFTATDDKEEKRKAMQTCTQKDNEAHYLRKPGPKNIHLAEYSEYDKSFKTMNQTQKIRNPVNQTI